VTERLVRGCGLPWTILRNGLYAELFAGLLTWTAEAPERATDGPQPAAGEALESAFGDGALAAVDRADLAEAAAAVAAEPAAHVGRTYELTGAPITAAQVAARLGVPHRTIALAEYRDRLHRVPGLLAFQPPMLLSIATSVRHGLLDGTGPDLAALLGRPAGDPRVTAAAVAAGTRLGSRRVAGGSGRAPAGTRPER
jgi:NAD(P)H dehydrogenase (quinone)